MSETKFDAAPLKIIFMAKHKKFPREQSGLGLFRSKMICWIGLFCLLMLPALSYGQTAERSIHVQTAGRVEIPADQILFSIQISLEADEPKTAFQQHRERENYLARLIKQSGIEESQITYQPVRISKVDRHRPTSSQNNEPRYQTRQQVQLRLSDFALFDTMQVKLIDHGFDTFSAQFSSSETDKGRKQALDKALEEARDKAQQIAAQMGLELGKIQNIDYSKDGNGPVYRSTDAFQMSSESMMDFSQTISVTESVSVTYSIASP